MRPKNQPTIHWLLNHPHTRGQLTNGQGLPVIHYSLLINHDFIGKEPGSRTRILHGMYTDVTGLSLAHRTVFFQEQLGHVVGDVAPCGSGRCERLSVYRQRYLHLLRHVYPGTRRVHERGPHIVYRLHLPQVDGYIEILQRPLPFPIAIGPSAADAVGQGRLSGGRVLRAVRQVVDHLTSLTQMRNRSQTLAPFPVFIRQVEGRVSLCPEQVNQPEGTVAETSVVLLFRPAPADFGNGERPRIIHVFAWSSSVMYSDHRFP